MIREATIKDLDFIYYVLRHPKIYKYIIDDGMPQNADNFRISLKYFTKNNKNSYLLMQYSNDIKIGVAFFNRLNYILYEGHQQILPEFRGKRIIKVYKETCNYMFTNTSCLKIIGYTPEQYRGAWRILRKCGFKVEGVIKKGILINNKFDNLIISGLCKEDILWLEQ